MPAVIHIKDLKMGWGLRRTSPLQLTVESGQVVGLIGLRGAGKTRFLKMLLGLHPYRGQIEILGLQPRYQRKQLMNRIGYLAEETTFPKWLTGHQAIDLMAGMYVNFNREKAHFFLDRLPIRLNKKIRTFPSGLIIQLHLALLMAIDFDILLLDEPTQGLDVLHRKEFHRQLFNDYLNEHRTIIIATHQVEEVEHLLTHVMMMHHEKIILNCPASEFGKLTAPSISDVFAAKVAGEKQ